MTQGEQGWTEDSEAGVLSVEAHTCPAEDFVAGERGHPEEHIDLRRAVQDLEAL